MAGRILVAYATKHGSTAGVAEAVARELTAAGLEAEAAAFPAVDSLEGYDGVVLGAPLYMGVPLDLAPFVARHRDALSRMPVAAFAVGLTPAAPEPKPEQVEQARKALIDALVAGPAGRRDPLRGGARSGDDGLCRAGRDAASEGPEPATSATGTRSARGPGRWRRCSAGMPAPTDTYIISSSA